MLNAHFKTAAAECKAIDKRENNMYQALATFCIEGMSPCPVAGTDWKPFFKKQEQLALAEERVKMGEKSTYRVIKSTLCQCAALGIALVDSDGKIRSKSELDDSIKAYKVEKSAFDQFKTSIEAATKQVDNMTESERILGAALVDDLLKSMSKQLRLVA